MIKDKVIGKYRFELDSNTNRIMVYGEGDGVLPVCYIQCKPNITEKEFDYEIMYYIIEEDSIKG
jgi:hypothetical protein